MGLIIEDGKGKGTKAGVDLEGRLVTTSIISTSEHHANHCNKNAYNLFISATPTGAGDCFLYLKNTYEIDLVIEGFSIWLAANEYIDFYIDDTGSPVGGIDIIPINLNSGSANSADGIFQKANDITGLVPGNLAERYRHATANGSNVFNFEQDIILVKNGIFTAYIGTGGTALEMNLYFNYHNCSDV